MKRIKLVFTGELSDKSKLVVSCSTALVVDGIDQLPEEEVQEAIGLVIEKLKSYDPKNKATVSQIITDAVNEAEAIADIADKSESQKGDKLTHSIGDLIKSFASGNFSLIGAVKVLFHLKSASKAVAQTGLPPAAK